MNASEMLATSRQPLSTVSACPRLGISTISVTPLLSWWRLNDAFAIAHGTVLSFSPETINSGPRSGFSVLTLASVHGFTLAVAAWKSGTPDAGTAKVLWRSFASSSLTAFAKPKRNWSNVSGTARFRLAGLPRTGHADFSAEKGNGSTPWKGAGSIATVAKASPRPARICASRPPNEWPITAGFAFNPRTSWSKWSAICPTVLWANTSGCAFASSTVSGSSGQPGVSAVYPAASNIVAQRSQLLGSSQRPWTNTTGCSPVVLARSTCSISWSVIVVAEFMDAALDVVVVFI